jgi:hypothetical protein
MIDLEKILEDVQAMMDVYPDPVIEDGLVTIQDLIKVRKENNKGNSEKSVNS